jgi:hypothetical protein
LPIDSQQGRQQQPARRAATCPTLHKEATVKKLWTLLALSSAFTATPSVAAGGSTTPPGRTDFIQFCKSDTAGSTEFTLGDCASYVTALLTNSNGYAAQDCDFWRTVAPDVFYSAYDTYDQCVRDRAGELPF